MLSTMQGRIQKRYVNADPSIEGKLRAAYSEHDVALEIVRGVTRGEIRIGESVEAYRRMFFLAFNALKRLWFLFGAGFAWFIPKVIQYQSKDFADLCEVLKPPPVALTLRPQVQPNSPNL